MSVLLNVDIAHYLMAAPIRSEWYDISNHVPTDRNWLLRFVLEGSDRIFGLFELGDRSGYFHFISSPLLSQYLEMIQQ